MEFIKTADWEQGIAALRQQLTTELGAGRKVLWLIAGGSNVSAAVKVMAEIPEELSAALTITLTDERYGEVGHKDSNWQQLLDAGFDFKHAKPVPVLSDGLSLEQTRVAFETSLQQLFDPSSVVVGQFGMGSDGHISGILPGSPAVTAPGLVAVYETPTFTRVTTTFSAIKRCTTGYLFAFGDDKKAALEQLQTDLSLSDQPAQVLKQVPQAYVYNDQLGGTT